MQQKPHTNIHIHIHEKERNVDESESDENIPTELVLQLWLGIDAKLIKR